MKLEICAGTWDSAKAAAEGGADRIELCSALSEGGLTPSVGLIKKALSLQHSLKVHVLIRPRSGDFLYTPDEVEMMAEDIRTAVSLGVDGVVIGALTADGQIDVPACKVLVAAAAGVQNITFHRAFDMCADPFAAMEQIIGLGCNRILTSGLSSTAEEGIPTLRRLVEAAKDRIIIMPGCGVSPHNARRILGETGATEIHASARSEVHSLMKYTKADVSMGAAGRDEFSRMETDPALVREIICRCS